MSSTRIELSKRLKRLLEITEDPEFTKRVFQAWLDLYQEYSRQRFEANSAGGGDWPDLKPETLAARRRHGNNDTRILVDTGAIEKNLDRIIGFTDSDAPEISGVTRYISFQDDGTPHPRWVKKRGRWRTEPGDKTIAEIAQFHQTGAGKLPKRKILFPPDKELQDKMKQAAKDILKQYMEQ